MGQCKLSKPTPNDMLYSKQGCIPLRLYNLPQSINNWRKIIQICKPMKDFIQNEPKRGYHLNHHKSLIYTAELKGIMYKDSLCFHINGSQ